MKRCGVFRPADCRDEQQNDSLVSGAGSAGGLGSKDFGPGLVMPPGALYLEGGPGRAATRNSPSELPAHPPKYPSTNRNETLTPTSNARSSG